MGTEEKKRDILKAASSCFSRYGYEKTTLDDIGRLVGLNKASLYYYFENKESIYTEVIYYEANEFLGSVFTRVDGIKGCREKILAYLSERLKYLRNAVNVNQLSIDSVQKLTPLFGEMYARVVEKEAAYLSGVLECCAKNGEILQCDTDRVARSILTVTDAIKNRTEGCAECFSVPESKQNETLNEITFTVSLILDGLKRK